ncbi:hypothetical protein N431DRAFT_438464 [Stipitochalara longipes BDJ]|nr:hypothetical protein N431DRAFT_438464 [Stipitochalara longipes BDJ]
MPNDLRTRYQRFHFHMESHHNFDPVRSSMEEFPHSRRAQPEKGVPINIYPPLPAIPHASPTIHSDHQF